MNQGSPHILVVDDHSEIRDLLKRFLEQHGMRVSCARDGKEMKRLLDEREFDLLVRFVRDEVFPFFTEAASRAAVNFMDGARLGIDDPTVLTQVVNLVDGLRLDQADGDTKGDLFEHVLKQISQAGELGQFRTPRHIIRAMVRMVDPQIGETVYDPAAGTAGFLVAAYDHIRLNNSSPTSLDTVELDGKQLQRGPGDRLSATKWEVLQHATFYGNDVDPKMVRLATMNLSLRGLPDVHIRRRNVLTTTLDAQQKLDAGLPQDGYQVILANPPFAGSLDYENTAKDLLALVKTKKTELLFLALFLRLLKPGGRAAVIVPDGVLFGSSKAHKELRRQLIEHHRVDFRGVLNDRAPAHQNAAPRQASDRRDHRGGRR